MDVYAKERGDERGERREGLREKGNEGGKSEAERAERRKRGACVQENVVIVFVTQM